MFDQDPKRSSVEKSIMEKEVRKKKADKLLKATTALSELLDLSGIKEQHLWYLGIVDCKLVENQFKKDGDYAVIAGEDQNAPKLFLVVLEDKKNQAGSSLKVIHQVPLVLEGTKWSLPNDPKAKVFKTVVELVEYFQKHKFGVFNGNANLNLVNACKRPEWSMNHSQLEVETSSILGSGNFCAVFRGKIKHRNLDVAVKICHSTEKSDSKSSAESIEKEAIARNALVNEGLNLYKLQNFNITAFYGICCDKQPIMIVMELCPGGDLLKHLLAYNDQIQIGERLKYAIEAASGVSYIHKKGIIHRDLAARNCLISKYGTIKIADFGLSKEVADNIPDDEAVKQQVPLRWMAPESLQREPKFSDKTDVWAFGMVLYEIFSNGQKPWDDWENKRVATHIRRCEMPVFPEKAPQEVKDLVKEKIWICEPLKRYNFHDIGKKLVKVQKAYPCPDPQKTTLQQITDVRVLTEAEIMEIKGIEKDEHYTEDIVAAVVSQSKDRLTTSRVVKKSFSAAPHALRVSDRVHQKGTAKESNQDRSRVPGGLQHKTLGTPGHKSTIQKKDRK